MENAPPGDRPVVVFDGLCNLCSRAVQLILDHDRRGRLMLAASQSQSGRALLSQFMPRTSPEQSVFLIAHGQLYQRSTAALRIARALGFPWNMFYPLLLVPRPLRDAVYDWVSRNRVRWFGRREACRVAQPGEEQRFLP